MARRFRRACDAVCRRESGIQTTPLTYGIIALLFVSPISGCATASKLDAEREVLKLRNTVEQKDRELSSQKIAISELNQRLADAQGVDQATLDKLFYPDSLTVERLSGGYNDDGQPGDDGVVIYLRPVDRSGDALKVAGDVRIQLYDLAAPPDQTFIGEYTFPADKIGEFWYGKLMSYHYALKCPWKNGPPAHGEVTARITFVNLFPQRVVTAQEVVRFKGPQSQTP